MTNVKNIAKSVTPEKKILQSQKSPNVPDYLVEEAKKELQLVKGRFRLFSKGCEGGYEKVTFRKYPEQICPAFSKYMKDGEVYEIPLYAARFINGFDSNAKAINGRINSCGVAKHGYKMNGRDDLKMGVEIQTEAGPSVAPQLSDVTHYDRRMGFESLEFSDILG